MRKLYFLFLLFPLLLFACAAPQATNIVVASATSQPESTIVAAATVLPTQTATAKFIPKQNDLLFIEFFAVT